MTTTQSYSEVMPMGTSLRADQPKPRNMDLFIADELFPMMGSFWPASSKSLNGNIVGNAIAYGSMLTGFSPKEIRDAVVSLVNAEPSRDFAPKPQELRQLCQKLTTPEEPKYRPSVSIRQIEMQAEVKVFLSEITQEQVDDFITKKIAEIQAKGLIVTGKAI